MKKLMTQILHIVLVGIYMKIAIIKIRTFTMMALETAR